jgi:uncharacterized coiled-coil DUF342 family protein
MDKVEIKIKGHRQKLEKIEQELIEVTSTLQEIQKEAEENHQQRLAKFKASIRPLEEAARTLEE